MGAVCCKLLSCCSGGGIGKTEDEDEPFNLNDNSLSSNNISSNSNYKNNNYHSSSNNLPLNPLSNSSIINKLDGEFEIKGKIKGSSQTTNCSKVFLVRHRASGSIFHLEQIKKSKLKSFNELFREVNLLATRLPHHPFLVNLYWTWQDEESLYRINEATSGTIIKPSNFDDFVLFAAQLAVALHYIHSCGLVHGNVSPFSVFSSFKSNNNNQNKTCCTLLLASFNHLQALEGGKRLTSIVGDDPRWRAPEINDKSGYFEEIDWYSYGKTLQFWLEELKSDDVNKCEVIDDFISKLLEERPEDRLGYGPSAFSSIQSHPIFNSTHWSPLLTFTVSKAKLKLKHGSASLGASIDSLKSKSTHSCLLLDSLTTDTRPPVEWNNYHEFGWSEHVEEGLMLENIIKNLERGSRSTRVLRLLIG